MTKAISQPSRRIYRQYPIEASRTPGVDESIPKASDHENHVKRVLAARSSGFPVMRL